MAGIINDPKSWGDPFGHKKKAEEEKLRRAAEELKAESQQVYIIPGNKSLGAQQSQTWLSGCNCDYCVVERVKNGGLRYERDGSGFYTIDPRHASNPNSARAPIRPTSPSQPPSFIQGCNCFNCCSARLWVGRSRFQYDSAGNITVDPAHANIGNPQEPSIRVRINPANSLNQPKGPNIDPVADQFLADMDGSGGGGNIPVQGQAKKKGFAVSPGISVHEVDWPAPIPTVEWIDLQTYLKLCFLNGKRVK